MSDHKSRTAETPEEGPRGESLTTDDELKEARMMTVTIFHDDGGTTIENPNFVDTLCNVNDVAVDGEIYSDVNQVVFMHDDDGAAYRSVANEPETLIEEHRP